MGAQGGSADVRQAVLTPIRPPLERDQQIVLDKFHCIDSSRAVRDVVKKYDVHHVIVGPGFIIPTMHRAPGLTNLGESRSLRLVYDKGGVKIYEVDLQPLVATGADAACQGATSNEGESPWQLRRGRVGPLMSKLRDEMISLSYRRAGGTSASAA